MDKTDFIAFHAATKGSPQTPSESALAGLMRWCVLAPCHPHPDQASHEPQKKSLTKTTENTPENANFFQSSGRDPDTKDEREGEGRESTKSEGEAVDFRALVAKLHANLLSVVLSDSQSFPRETLTGDHMAVTVAALLGLSHHQPAQLRKRGKAAPVAVEEGEGGKSRELEESVERLAQFLQISLSTGLLVLSSGMLIDSISAAVSWYIFFFQRTSPQWRRLCPSISCSL